MARILIREGSPEIERLLATVTTRCGHEIEVIAPDEPCAATGHLLLLDPTATDAVACVELLRRLNPRLLVVCIGCDPKDPLAEAIQPISIVPRPFRVAELINAFTLALHEAS